MKIVLASSNLEKIAELRSLFAMHPINIVLQSDYDVTDAEETGLTFVENALIKARHACEKTGLPALADDSGLVVPALSGAPGIHSARYAGDKGNAKQNIEKLLDALAHVPLEKRNAFFHCSLVFLQSKNDQCPIICEGNWHGRIVMKSQGTHGFGYDPIFFDLEQNCTAAELSSEIKNKRSHRGQAMQKLLHHLTETIRTHN